MDSALADALIGRTLDGRYHVRSRIAHGGMATVYLATDTRLDRQVALKVMHAELARDDDFVSRFIGEAKSVARLSHPNIVAVFDQGSDGQFLYLAMEYVAGQTLRSLLRERGWLPYGEALDIMDPILSGLAAAHRAGIVHRDVKPENVLLTADGRVKVVDFGLARAQAASGHTRSGVVIGTVAYLAPEQVTGGVTDFRTDVYAAGVMLFEMLTGRQPHTGDSPLAVAYSHVNSDIPAPATLVAGLPPAIDGLVRAAASRDPQRRPGNAEELLHAVRALRGGGTAAAGAGEGEGGAVSGAWQSVPYLEAPVAAGAPASAEGTSHTMVVGGYGAAPWPGASPGYGADPGYGASPGYGAGYRGREPFLQRWLFSRRLGFVAAGVAVVLAIGVGGWWLTSGRYTPLPPIVGVPQARAVQLLRAAGFNVQADSRVTDNSVPSGDVISASPADRAVKGATIMLRISSGPRMIVVPPVTGQSLSGAEATLRKAGLHVAGAPKLVGSSNLAVGTIAGTTPPAGTSWPQNRLVYVDKVAGLAMPPLVGQNIGDVQSWAGQNHVQLNVRQVASNQPQGTIVSQSAPAGSLVTPGEHVTVNVSNGPPTVQIPNVQGESFQQAQHQLQKAGFQVNGQQFGPGNTVFGTSPSGQAPQGSTITVFYGF